MIKQVKVKISSITPLLMHRFPTEPVEAIEKKSKEEQADLAAYRMETGELFIPSIAIQRALVQGAAYSKGKGRGSLKKQAAACILVFPEHVLLGTQEYVIDSRAVVVPATRGRIMRHRPRFDEWSVAFEVEYDDVLISEKQLRQIIDDAGLRVGLLDFRPERNGSFGRYKVSGWDKQQG